MRYFDREQVETFLDMRGCVGVMPAALLDEGIVGAKLITVYPGNFRRGLPSHQGVVALFSTDDGSLQTILDSAAIIRARLFYDSRESRMGEAGDFLFPLESGEVGEEHLLREYHPGYAVSRPRGHVIPCRRTPRRSF